MWWVPLAMQAGSNVLGGIGANESANAYADSINGALPGLQKQYATGMNQSVEGWKPYAAQGQASLADLAAWRPEQMGQFQYGKDVNSFLDPSMKFQQDQMRAAQAESAAGRGMSLSGAAAKELAQLQTNLSQTDYQNSWNRMQQDRTNVYGQFLNEFNAKNAASQNRYNQLGTLVNLGTTAQGQITNAQQNIATNGYNTGMYGAQASAQQDAANAGFGWNMAAGLLGTGGQAVAAYNALPPKAATTAAPTVAPTANVAAPTLFGQQQAQLTGMGYNTSLANQTQNPAPTNLSLNQQVPNMYATPQQLQYGQVKWP